MNIMTPLTNRELEVLHLISYEHTNSEIADLLELSIHTVDTHRENLYAKLDVKKSASAVRRGYELKILPYKKTKYPPNTL